MAKAYGVFLLTVICVSSSVTDDAGPKTLTSLLRPSWGYTPFLLEARSVI
jgi:hypothetical protein